MKKIFKFFKKRQKDIKGIIVLKEPANMEAVMFCFPDWCVIVSNSIEDDVKFYPNPNEK